MIGIYKITSPSNKVYIGQSINIEKRWVCYKRLENCKQQPALYNSFNKHNVENHIFEVIEECEIEQLNIRERYWQEFYEVIGSQGLNSVLTKTDEKTQIVSEEAKRKMRESRLGKEPWNKGKPYLKIRGENHHTFGKSMSLSTREAISKANLGKPSHKKGIPSNPESIAKMKETKRLNPKSSFKGRTHSEESLSKISENRTGKCLGEDHHFSKVILDLETGIFYFGCTEASKVLNIKPGTLQSWLSGSRPNKSSMMYV